MSIDAYTGCPCGSGKKLKFCCCKDMIHDLEKVIRAFDGEQRRAALDLINRLIADKGPRPALLALQAEGYLSLDEFEPCEKAVNQLLETVSHNPVALALRAIVDSVHGDAETAVERLQEALESTDQTMYRPVYLALGVVGTFLASTGKILAGRGHLLFQAALGHADDSDVMEALVRINSVPSVPILLKQDFILTDGAPDVPWRGEYHAALKSARRGTWRVACEILESLNQKVPDQPCVWRSIAILRSWLGQNDLAVVAWRKYASLSGVSYDDAVEAEALASLLAGPAEEDLIDVVKLTFHVPDTDRLMERMLSDRLYDVMDVNLSELAEEGEPPPKGAFHIFDRAVPTHGEEISSVQQLPRVIGEAFVYGRQTDRPARLEVIMDRGRQFEAHRAAIASQFAELVGPLERDEIVEQTTRVRVETAPKRQFPKDLAPDRMRELIQEQRREVYLQIWPEVPQGNLGGKSLREAASDPALRTRAAAAVLNLELASEESTGRRDFDFNELRRQVGLPERGESQVAEGRMMELSLARLGRVDFSRLTDSDLLQAYNRAGICGYRGAIYGAGREILVRPSLEKDVDKVELCRSLINLSANLDESLQLAEEGRRRSVARGQSPAPWLLAELQIRFLRLEADEINRLIQQLTAVHGREPGVREALFSLLVRFGILNPDGTPAGGPPSPAVGAPQTAAATAAAPPGSGLWTPGAAASAPQADKKLWIPGSG